MPIRLLTRAVQIGALLLAASAFADVNTPEANGTTPLHWAVYQQDAALVKRLLAAGAKLRSLAMPKLSRCCWPREPTWNRPMPKDKPR